MTTLEVPTFGLSINGVVTEPQTGRHFVKVQQLTGQPIAAVAAAGTGDVEHLSRLRRHVQRATVVEQ